MPRDDDYSRRMQRMMPPFTLPDPPWQRDADAYIHKTLLAEAQLRMTLQGLGWLAPDDAADLRQKYEDGVKHVQALLELVERLKPKLTVFGDEDDRWMASATPRADNGDPDTIVPARPDKVPPASITGLVGDGTSGQDRESYTDVQDRKTYSDPEEES